MWTKIKTFFKDSETIFWARLQAFAGVVFTVLSTVNLSPLLPPKYLTIWLILSGVVTELLRRRRVEM
mgnify:CR=1 FL=1